MRRCAFAGVGLLLLGAPLGAPLAAQDTSWTRLQAIEPGHVVRVEGETFPRWQASLDRVGADSLHATEAGIPRSIPREAVQRVYERGRSTKTGAIVGGIGGGVIGAVILAAVCHIVRSDGTAETRIDWLDCAAIGLGGGAVGGAGIGAGIGLLIPKWRLRYRAP